MNHRYPIHRGRLTNKVIIVTGGASGLGLAAARRLHAEGAKLAVADIDSAGARAAAVELNATRDDASALAVTLDITSENDWQAAFSAVYNWAGTPTGVVNNAGITTMGSIEDLSLAAFRHELEVDVVGTFLGCKYAVMAMRDTGGSIINMSSLSGLKARGDLVGYNSAKAAVTHMTKSIALHCADRGYNIRCNSVHPGAIRTAIIDKVLAQVADPAATLASFEAAHPLGHLGSPEDIAAIVAYLCSDESSFATGAAFSVDGGASAL